MTEEIRETGEDPRTQALVETISKCRDRFLSYAQLHLDKLTTEVLMDKTATSEILGKARGNKEMAEECSRAIENFCKDRDACKSS